MEPDIVARIKARDAACAHLPRCAACGGLATESNYSFRCQKCGKDIPVTFWQGLITYRFHLYLEQGNMWDGIVWLAAAAFWAVVFALIAVFCGAILVFAVRDMWHWLAHR